MNTRYTPVLLITGYLGSGKTTLLNRILTNKRGIRFAVIVNDLGEVNIDASLIREGGIVGSDDSQDLVSLQNGCICCTLKADLMKQLAGLIETDRFDYIAIEASGICEPAPIAQTVCSMEQMINPSRHIAPPRMDCIVTVVDALRMKTEFGAGAALRKKNIGEEDIENLIIEQIEFCNIILLNKVSEVSREEADDIKAVIRALQPKARILECDYADVPLDEILDTGIFDFERVATSATWVQEIEHAPAEEHHKDYDHADENGNEHGHHHHHHHDHEEGEAEEYGIGTYVYFRRRPFNFEKFDRFVNLHWPDNIIRAKGVVYFSQNRDMSILFEQAGVQKNIKEAGYWFATAPSEELEMMMARDENLRRDWDPVYGDRMIKLVLIGRHVDPAAIDAMFDPLLD